MRLQQYYSGSTGNFYILESDSGKRLMIECGVPFKKILKALDFRLKDIAGCLISHEHGDHSKAYKEVMQAGIDIYSSTGTFEALGISEHRRALTDFGWLKKHGFHVNAFDLNHDAAEPYMFVIGCDGETMLFATDTSFIKQKFVKIKFDIIAIECSYDADILQAKVEAETINEALATRLLTSHMEVKETKRYLKECCDLSRCQEIHLIHLSGSNIVKDKIKDEFESEFLIETIICED